MIGFSNFGGAPNHKMTEIVPENTPKKLPNTTSPTKCCPRYTRDHATKTARNNNNKSNFLIEKKPTKIAAKVNAETEWPEGKLCRIKRADPSKWCTTVLSLKKAKGRAASSKTKCFNPCANKVETAKPVSKIRRYLRGKNKEINITITYVQVLPSSVAK